MDWSRNFEDVRIIDRVGESLARFRYKNFRQVITAQIVQISQSGFAVNASHLMMPYLGAAQ